MQITHHIEIHERKYNYKYQSVLCLGESYRLIYNTLTHNIIMATKHLATWALALQFGNLTEPVVDMAVKSVYNWAGCAIGGYALPPAGVALEAMSPFTGSDGNSTVFGVGQHVDIRTAAMINGIASHADDYDDTHIDTPVHPSGPVASALFAMAEWMGGVTGEEFLAAFVAGVETECKLGVAVFPDHYTIGWRE